MLVASVPLSADDQAKRSEQRNAAAAAIAGLHDALVAAKAGPLLGSLSDGAASYTITRVWEALLERLEYSMYNGQPHTEASIKGQRSPPRDLPASQLSAAVSRAGEIMSAAASTTSDGAAAVAAATEKMLCLCTLANETTPALLDRYMSGGDAVLSRQRSSNGSAETFHGCNIELSVLVHVRCTAASRNVCVVVSIDAGVNTVQMVPITGVTASHWSALWAALRQRGPEFCAPGAR